jgi:transcriptional regulator with XRE-family HTH domain
MSAHARIAEVHEIRRQHIRRLAEQHTAAELARRLGLKSSSFISQIAGPAPVRPVTEKTARRIEEVMGLEPGLLDLVLEDLDDAGV